MHLTLKKETTRPPNMNSLQQQARFDLEQKTLQPIDNPFGTRLSPMS